MGNMCTHHNEEKIVYLEGQIEDQNSKIEELLKENRWLKRENKYLNRRNWNQVSNTVTS